VTASVPTACALIENLGPRERIPGMDIPDMSLL
jgi:hypothetical protein